MYPDNSPRPTTEHPRRRWLLQAAALLGAPTFGSRAQAQTLKGLFMRDNTPETAFMKWTVSFCSYGIDIAPREQTTVKTLTGNNWLKDADGKTVALFYTGFGAAWGRGSSGMGGPDRDGARLPKTLRLSYYDTLEDRFYQLDAELPLRRLFDLFIEAPKIVAKKATYGKVRPRYEDLRIGIAPDGHVMLWVWGLGSQVELATYRARVLEGMTAQSYNASRPPASFALAEDRWLGLGRMTPPTHERIKAGWRPDPMWYMRHIRVKFPWRHVLTGNVSRVTELESLQGNAEAENVGQWEMNNYVQINRLRGIPESAFFWFHDRKGQRHYLWLQFFLRERAVSESDLSEVRAAFDQVFPGRKLEDNDWLPGDADMARVEVNVSDDFKTFTAVLVKGDVRLPLPVGKTQHFELEPFTHWRGNKSEEITPDERKLFQMGPQG
jgi:hypothetical protein